jgi:PAS domain S-box-containing protein
MDTIGNRKLSHYLGNISMYLSVLTVAVAIAVMTGWIFDITFLISVSPGFVSMKFNTALGFLFLGAALFIFHQKKIAHRKTISAAFASVVLLISILTLIQYVFNTDLGIDELFIKDHTAEVETYSPGRMASATGTCFLIAASALGLLVFRKRKFVFVSQVVSLGLILFILVPVLGYITGSQELYVFTGSASMAVHTALLFLVSVSGILIASPGSGIVSVITGRSISGYIIRKLVPASLLIPLILLILLLIFETAGINDIQLVVILLIIGFTLFLFWFLQLLESIERSRARAMDKVNAANERFSHYIENSPLAMIEWDSKFRVKRWSWQAEVLFGWKAGEVISKHPDDWNFVHRDDKEEVGSTMQKLLTGEESGIILAGRNYTKKGETVHCVWYNSVLHDNKGKLISILSQINNITRQKNTERKLAESEEQYRSLVEISQDAILVNQDDRIVFFNPAALRLFGAGKREQITMKPSIDLFHKDYHERIKGRINELRMGRPVPVIEEKIVRFDGTTVDVEVAATSFVYKKKPAILVVVRDITDRKMALDKLKKNEFLLRMAANLALVGGWIVDLSAGRVTWSPQVAAIHGMPADYSPTTDEAIGFYAPEYTDRIKRAFNKCATDGISYDEELELTDRSGRRVWVRTIGVAERDDSGNIINVIGGFQDISQRKKIEQDIKKLNEELEQRVRERTRQLEASNKDLEAFGYSVSHDLRAPLRAINGFTRILLEDHASRLDADGKRICYTVMDNARKMGQLIEELLAFSRLGSRKFNFSDIDMGRLAVSVFHEVTTDQQRQRINFKADGLCPAYGDPAMIRQALTNLIANAVKFTSTVKKPRIRVFCNSGQDSCVFGIQDNGVGFDMKYADRIFGVFKKLHSAREYEGSGVGLAIVQRIIDRHGGTITAQGAPGKGAVFSFTLPNKKSGRNGKIIYPETQTEEL